MDIKKYIPKGHESAVTIETLMAMTGMSNRQVRRAIAESDAIIINMQDICIDVCFLPNPGALTRLLLVIIPT